MSRDGFYGRRMVPEPLIKILQEMKEAGITKEDIQALSELTDLLEDKASLSGINTFTGINTFNGDEVNVNGTLNYNGDDIDDKYQGKLYRHVITFNGFNDLFCSFDILSTKSSALTSTEILAYFNSNLLNDKTNFLNCSGFISQDSGYLISGIYYSTTNNRFLFICYNVDGADIIDNYPALDSGSTFLSNYIDNIIETN